MSNDSWYFNRLGRMAQATGGGRVPNYGLTIDTALAPWDDDQEFSSLVQTAPLVSQFAGGATTAASAQALQQARAAGPVQSKQTFTEPDEASLWDLAKGAAHLAGNFGAGAIGAVYSGLDAIPGLDMNDETKKALKGKHGTDRLVALGKAGLGGAVETPGVKEGMEAVSYLTDKASEYGATFFLAADDPRYRDMAIGEGFAAANKYVNKHHLNIGQGFMQLLYDDEVLDDDKRMEQLRQHSSVYNFGSLAFNVIAGLKYDPNVILGKGVGALRNSATKIGPVRLGRAAFAEDAATQGLQRDIIAAGHEGGREAAEAIARQQTGLKGRVQAHNALNMFDRSLELQKAAKDMRLTDFMNLPAFQRSGSGSVMAAVMHEVAGNDAEWGLVFRSAIGDPRALEELRGMRGEIADKIKAIETDKLGAEEEFQRALDKYNKRVAEQGVEPDALDLTDHTNWLLDTHKVVAEARVNRIQQQLNTYSSKESWLDRVVAGSDNESSFDGAFFGSLRSVSASRGILQDVRASVEPKFYGLTGKVSVFQHDAFSPLVRYAKAPAATLLKRYSHIDLHDQEAALGTLQHSLDQFAHVMGKNDLDMRDHILSEYAKAGTDVSRNNLLGHMHLSLFRSLGAKYGIDNAEMMDLFGKEVLNRRGQAWASMAEVDRWKTISSQSGASRKVLPLVDDSDAGVTLLDSPLSVTDLPNHFPMVNWLDLDHTIRMNRDLIQELGAFHRNYLRGRRTAEWAVNWAGKLFNSFWKPLQLISLRWPIKSMMDEAYGITHLVGALPMLHEIGKSAGNVFFNKGIIRPREYYKGRWVNTGSMAEESLRTRYDEFDPFDHRSVDNPTAAVPYEAGEFHKHSPKRYDAINRLVGERLDHYDRIFQAKHGAAVAEQEMGRSMGNAVRNAVPQGKQAWEQQWDDRLAAAEAGDSKGFIFDPASDKAHRKGFAVSVYPGRLKTFDGKPSAEALARWTRDNSDLLAIPSNRAAVWLDRETGRWHLDVVRTQARREDAMLLAGQANADEFFDVAGGFTRYMAHEDPYQHYSSPLVQQSDEAKALRAKGAAQAQATDAKPVSGEKHAGFGKRTWVGPDGQKIEDEAVFGPEFDNKNMLFSLVSAKNYMQALYGGHTAFKDVMRRKHNAGKAMFEPGSGRVTDPQTADWKAAWANEMNRHFRFDPVWRRMLAGESDEKIIEWLWSAEGRRAVRQRIIVANPRDYVHDMRSQFDDLLPTQEARALVLEREVSVDDVDAVIPHDLRGSFRTDDLRVADRTQQTSKWQDIVAKIYNAISSGPSDALVRHPFANLVYDTRLKNYYASLPPGTEITVEVQNAARASARAFALKQTRRMLYNIAEENNAAHMLRFTSPFFQAQLEVAQRYGHIFTEHPEALARTLFLFNKSQTSNSFWVTTDKDGNPATSYDPDNQVIIQVKPWMRSLVNHIPGLKHGLDNMGGLPVPAKSLDLMFQGTFPLKPEFGPMVAFPASELYFKDHPKDDTNAFYKWLFPYGQPRGSNAVSRLGNSILPAYLRRILVAATDDQSDSAHANLIGAIVAEKTLAFQREHGRAPTQGEIDQLANAAIGEAKGFYYLRAIASFGSPLPIQGAVKHQYYIDQARKYKKKFGVEWEQKFFDDYGPEYFRFAVSGSKSNNGLSPTTAGVQGYHHYKSLIDLAPELAGLIVGPDGAQGDFSGGAYQWQLNTKLGPGSKKTMREVPDARTQVENQQIETGWQMWAKVQAGVDAELRANGFTNVMQSGAEDIYINMQKSKRKIIEMNPAWEGAYNSREEELPNLIHKMGSIAFSPKLDGRPDIMGLRAYLLSRKEMQKVLIARQEAGIVQSASLYWKKDPNTGAQVPSGDNAPLAAAWQSYVRQLTAANPMFAEVYHRYLESDDLSAMGGY